ncbi:MAG TPA: hypothetical protein VGR35_18000 [Tepidisphaeraceae bacterium]|nr:hypothetical protein [Tepidisphaeraceae bacterium]
MIAYVLSIVTRAEPLMFAWCNSRAEFGQRSYPTRIQKLQIANPTEAEVHMEKTSALSDLFRGSWWDWGSVSACGIVFRTD